MNNYYIKLAKYLDKIGKYKQADNVEKFIKSAQYSAVPTYQSGGPRSQFQGGYFDATAMGKSKEGFNASLQYGVGPESREMGVLGLDPRTMKLLSPEEIFNYNTQVGEQLVEDAKSYTGPNRFQQMIVLVANNLNSKDPQSRAQIYQNNLEEVISSEISNLVLNGTPQNLNMSLNLLRQINLPEVFSRTVPKAIQFALQSMSLDTNPQVIQRYNQFVNDATVKQYAPGFNPI